MWNDQKELRKMFVFFCASYHQRIETYVATWSFPKLMAIPYLATWGLPFLCLGDISGKFLLIFKIIYLTKYNCY